MPNSEPGAKTPTKAPFEFTLAFIVFVFLELLVAGEALLAYRDHFFTVTQMQEKGVNQGLPFAWHFAMWGDLIFISSLAAYIVCRYFRQWQLQWVIASLAVGFVSATILSWTYTFSEIPEAHVQNHQLTAAGYVHLIYMAFAISIFTQFLFFTKIASVRLLRFVSILLFLHVFIGTHMALGILSAAHPLNWYPAEPLKSIAGWIIVIFVALGLIWRNTVSLENVLFETIAHRLLRAGVAVYMFLTGEDPRPIEGYFKLLNRISDSVITLTYFFKLFWLGLQNSNNAMPLALMFIIAAKYFMSRVSVKQELEIGKSLFTPGNVPDDLQLKDRFEITVRVIGFLFLYMLLGSLSDHVILASAILTMISCNDFVTQYVIKQNMERVFSDPHYAPAQTGKDYQTILDKRAVAKWYLFKLPHFWKEAGCAVGCALACCVATYGYFNYISLDFYAYAILIGTLLLNELIILWWRIDRYRRLTAIDSHLRSLSV